MAHTLHAPDLRTAAEQLLGIREDIRALKVKEKPLRERLLSAGSWEDLDGLKVDVRWVPGRSVDWEVFQRDWPDAYAELVTERSTYRVKVTQ